MNPSDIRFTAIEGQPKSCKGCLFEHEPYKACCEASKIAVANGLFDCDVQHLGGKEYIYVTDKSDPRQLSILEVAG